MSQANHHAHKLSALDEIDSLCQPMGQEPALGAEVDRLVESEDVSALVSLYEAYVASAMAFLSLENQPRSSGTQTFLEEERAHAWSKAFYVADRLKTLRPYEYDDLERYAATLFNCTLAMGTSRRRSPSCERDQCMAKDRAGPTPELRASRSVLPRSRRASRRLFFIAAR